MSDLQATDRIAQQADRRSGSGAAYAVATYADPRAVEAGWRRLEADGCLTAFQKFDWAAPWYAAMAAFNRAEPLIVVVKRVGDDAPVAILPLARTTSRLGRCVSFADLAVSDYAGPVLAHPDRLDDDDARAAIGAALAAIDDADFVKFEKLAPIIGGRPNPLFHWAGARAFPASAYAAPVARPFAAVEQRFDKSLLKNLKRGRRLLGEQKGPWTLVRSQNTEEAALFFSDMVDQRRERFHALGEPDFLADPAYRIFYSKVLAGDPTGAFATVFAIKVGEEVVAAEFGLLHSDAFLALLPSYRRDGEWKRYGLGQILTVAIMEWCAENGFSRYDMTIGDETYKFAYAVEECPLRALLLPLTPRGRVVAALWRLKEDLRRNPRLFAAAKATLGRVTGRI